MTTTTTQFVLWFAGGTHLAIGPPDKAEKIDGLDALMEWLMIREWFYHDGKLINVKSIQYITIIQEKPNKPVEWDY